MMRFALLLIGALALTAQPARAQLALPGAVAPTPKGAAVTIRTGKKTAREGAGRGAAPPVQAVADRALLLNGSGGLLQFAAKGKALHIVRLRLPGEGVSDSSQRCVVDIVGDAPIEAKSLGRPDGLERFEAEVPACPFTFDVLDGAVLAPAQTTACVFQAADCQASPGGLWGPEGGGLAKSAAAVAKERSRADATMVANLGALEARLKDTPEAADLAREQTAFAATRDEACRDYARETVHGFCASRLTEARAAALRARLEALGQATAGEKDGAKPSGKARRKAKDAAKAANAPNPLTPTEAPAANP